MDSTSNRVKENHTIAADILDDLASRFIINIPDADRSNFVRVCFQIELAHWFYLDFYCTGDDNNASVPCGIKQFASHIFNHIPFLSLHVKNLDNILQEWKQYKMSVPTYGAILMTADLKHVLLVQSYWAKSSWGFPKGKVNENEDPLRCAIREVYEETGYDIANLAEPDVFIEGVLNYQYTRLYLIRNVPIETVFVPRTRKEIKCCEWFAIEHLPTHKTDPVSRNHLGINANSFFMIMPFVKRLRKWINEQQGPPKLMPMHLSGQTNRKIKADNKTAGNVAGTQGTNHHNNHQGGANSPRNVFFKNNAGPRRQRHKSMGDLDSDNVVTHESTSDNYHSQNTTPAINGQGAHSYNSNNNSKPQQAQTPSSSQQQPQQNGSTNKKSDSDGMMHSSKAGGKRKLFPTIVIEQSIVKRTSSPLMEVYSNSRQVTTVQYQKNNNSNTKPNGNVQNTKIDSNRKKKNAKPWTNDQNAKLEQANDGHADLGGGQTSENAARRNVFEPPQLAQLLRNEPNINKWRNVRLNKDIIMNESLKFLM